MRYVDTGEVHKDFHLATDTTIKYVLSEYGTEFLAELFRRTAQQVYKDIYENLKKGNYEPLLEHLNYYYTREDGVFSVADNVDDEGFIFHVTDCPGVRHLKENNIPVEESYYLQISMMLSAWAEGTPFEMDFELISEGNYKMIVGRKGNDSK